jgi:hypothetical protein
MKHFAALSLALSLLSGCVVFTEEPMGPCWGLLCGDCIASGCTWDTRDRRCVVAEASDPSNGPNQRRTQRIDRCPAEQREVRLRPDASDANASDAPDARCGHSACGPCADEEGCDWDLLDSVCRSRGAAPVGHPVATARRDCDTVDAGLPQDAQSAQDAQSEAGTVSDAALDSGPDALADAASDVVDGAASDVLRLRVVNALAVDRAIDLCVGPSGGPSARLIESVTPGGLRRAFRTAALVAGAASSSIVATVVDAGSSPCATATPIGAPITIDPGPAGTQWFVVHSEGVTRFAVDTLAPATLRLRWLTVAASAGTPTFEYDLAGRGTISWTVRDRFGFNADTMLPSYVTALPSVAATNRLRATMVGGATTIETLRAIPTTSGSFTAVLVQTPSHFALPAQLLLLNEGDTSPTRSAVW